VELVHSGSSDSGEVCDEDTGRAASTGEVGYSRVAVAAPVGPLHIDPR